ncbi:Bbp19 family protein [Niveispirillum cyanobacteriorum]|uniref:Bbp19-like phage domain-containing protein n=1 Tax=Niveispirillum cyanobacteriorum TaxID=1612173 RepID=A0A2K9NE18_9PROT|nr:hypothetical protein [Niveispirillum cyanobacteriorum]AUN30766.1 hypothetical protein C0V82_11310 [Niveispirillum cyanobacteriorum]GGE79375.1 hypothetical protein GCM10011317_40650 [Niveispirillum cyanobacteriorum]
MAEPGWPWAGIDPDPAPQAEDRLAAACARLFATADGHLLLSHLTRITLTTSPGPDVTEARLRHLEGQRALVLTLRHLACRGGLAMT